MSSHIRDRGDGCIDYAIVEGQAPLTRDCQSGLLLQITSHIGISLSLIHDLGQASVAAHAGRCGKCLIRRVRLCQADLRGRCMFALSRPCMNGAREGVEELDSLSEPNSQQAFRHTIVRRCAEE